MEKLRRWVLRFMISSNLRHKHHDSWLIDAEISEHGHVSPQRLTCERLAAENPAHSASGTRLVRPLQQPRGLLRSRSWSSSSLHKYAQRSETTNSRSPKGYVAVYVGQNHHQQERFLIPISYLSQPDFQELLKRAENEFGFKQKGGLVIPCTVSEFQRKISLIEPDDHPHCLSLQNSSWSRTRSFKRL